MGVNSTAVVLVLMRLESPAPAGRKGTNTVAVDVAAEALGRLTGEKPDDKNLAKAVDAAMKAEG